jgi:hypothetical protein
MIIKELKQSTIQDCGVELHFQIQAQKRLADARVADLVPFGSGNITLGI